MTEELKNKVFAIGSIVVAIYLGYESFSYPSDSSLFPRSLAVIMGCLGLIFLIRITLSTKSNDLKLAQPSKEQAANDDKQSLKSACLVFSGICIYALLMVVVNYEIATAIFLAAFMVILKYTKKFRLLLIALGLTVLLWGIFFHLLGVSRPESIFFS